MNAGRSPLWPEQLPRRAAIAGLGAGLVLLVWSMGASSGVPAAGWLVGLVFWLALSLGALCLLAIRVLTGGAWGGTLGAAIEPAALSLPVFLPLAVPLFLALPSLYPWATGPDAAVHADVARLYLNPHGFVLRGFFALAGWAVLAYALVLLPAGRLRTVAGGVALVFHYAATTLLAIDWLLSLDPRFQSTAFGMAALVTQLLLALSWAAALRPEPGGEEGGGRAGDLAAMLFAAALGALYLGFSQYLVAWYGDLPPKAAWFLARQGWGWGALQAASITLSAILPIGGLLFAQVRQRPAALGLLGPCVMLGVAAHLVWIVAPPFGAWALLSAVLGVVAVGGLWLALVCGPLAAQGGVSREAARAA